MTDVATMRRLRQQGIPDADIAGRQGVTRQYIHKRLGPRQAPEKHPPAPLPRPGVAAFPDALRRFRADRNLTQHEAAQWLGVADSTWAHWEQGTDCPIYYLILFILQHAK